MTERGMSEPRTTRTPRAACPSCGHRRHAATGVNHADAPKPSGYTVCIECGAVLQFDGLMVARAVPWREWAQHPAAPQIMKAKALLRQFHEERGRG